MRYGNVKHSMALHHIVAWLVDAARHGWSELGVYKNIGGELAERLYHSAADFSIKRHSDGMAPGTCNDNAFQNTYLHSREIVIKALKTAPCEMGWCAIDTSPTASLRDRTHHNVVPFSIYSKLIFGKFVFY